MKTPIWNLMDVRYIKRWAMVGVATPDSVASHSFCVAMLAMAINKEMGEPFSEKDVCYYALIHDVLEAFSSDVPTPVKERMAGAGFNFNALYKEQAEPPCPPELKDIIKMADLMDCFVFISENGVGMRSEEAREDISARLEKMDASIDRKVAKACQQVYMDIGRRGNENAGDGVARRDKVIAQGPVGPSVILDRKSIN